HVLPLDRGQREHRWFDREPVAAEPGRSASRGPGRLGCHGHRRVRCLRRRHCGALIYGLPKARIVAFATTQAVANRPARPPSTDQLTTAEPPLCDTVTHVSSP